MLQHAARTLSLDKVLYEEGLSFGIVRHYRQIQSGFIRSVDALILQPASPREFESILRELRAMPAPEDYLKPVLSVDTPKLRESFQFEIDGFAKLDDLSSVVELVRGINSRIEKIASNPASSQGFDTEVLQKILQFIYTRQKALQPKPNRLSKIHYHYPFASYFLEENEEQRLLSIFKIAEKKGYLKGELVDKIHLCPECGSAHNNLRATCTKCKSVDITEEDLVHHFPCANIAPVSDFKKHGHDGLHCPKCDKSLRHIGNDYDKPASIFNCNQCHHTFQQAQYRSLCIDCGEDIELHRLEEVDIRQYQLTAKGTSVVQTGEISASENGEAKRTFINDGIYSLDVFKILLKQEMARLDSHSERGLLGQVRFEGLLTEEMSETCQEALTQEVCQIIKSYLKNTDVVSAKGVKSYYFLMPQSSIEETAQLKDVLTYNLQQILSSNLRQKTVQAKVVIEKLAKQA